MAGTAFFAAPIQKELIPFLHFPKEDVLPSAEQRKLRQQNLEKATALGNLNHTKVCIIFRDIHGPKQVETTIWATTEESIVLKKGVVIPIRSIIDVHFV
ncbi:MAG: hypothetical protein KatS3mg031_0887 [Chitinophagales bacterium]|nr:MAG: hypothetical protein KatS3mg031_0887 [Chitinophagales bacterium]